MKGSLFVLQFIVSAALAAVQLPRGWFTIQPTEKIKPGKFQGKPRYLTWMADSQIQHGVEPTLAYTVSAFYSGVLLAYERTGDKKYFDYVKHGADILLYPEHDGTVLFYNNSNSIDDIRIGHTFLDMFNATGDEIYKKAATHMRNQIDRTGRTPEGGFYHRYPGYIDQMWLDGIYMLDVFYARWTYEFEPDNTTAWDDIALQFDIINKVTTSSNHTNGLPVHGFDAGKTQVWADPVTGAAPHVWGRAVGWYIMALVDTLDYFPESHSGRKRLISYLKSLIDAIVAAQDPKTKGWWLIMDPELAGVHGNYIESSGSAMCVNGLLKALRMGYISGKKYTKAALDGYELMTTSFAQPRGHGALAWEWTVQTGSLSSNGTFEYYASMPLFQNDLKGVAPFLFASYEYELFSSKS
ncbi:hypothetical protein NW754_014544 [Fusarium falciforme]|uniref:Unsaturated rhamnogalacturonyl hydrolase YteR n=1 Tax=Fusarium falciforme TaxID=195108 RepID=A0A9W8QVB5_9HYPO|nr:Hypothetical protein NCS54_00991100 [Fusarium falciforme]KAJ4163121.1 hypothetical protein NW754_014544 [Fusarium falciforme]KAJ4179260.1 hypothetical protein NW755_012604 [Fusarium falciforme]KAJ4186009.1 hypothetical protein NW767_012748 [Fusarium falciforme]KAJ4243006.1 hypothetical protein NW757_011537 [Fusarium falciforme]WAO92403.1 Hypothetical protein NCS54_00991100 [Fusarium falciforme]